jgi:hypothetical protein
MASLNHPTRLDWFTGTTLPATYSPLAFVNPIAGEGQLLEKRLDR